MSEVENKLRNTMDAHVWAKEFVKIHGGDEGLMIGWFANAIMTTSDIKDREMEKIKQDKEDLYQYLDNIDTVSDIAKNNNAMYKGLVEKEYKKRFSKGIPDAQGKYIVWRGE